MGKNREDKIPSSGRTERHERGQDLCRLWVNYPCQWAFGTCWIGFFSCFDGALNVAEF